MGGGVAILVTSTLKINSHLTNRHSEIFETATEGVRAVHRERALVMSLSDRYVD